MPLLANTSTIVVDENRNLINVTSLTSNGNYYLKLPTGNTAQRPVSPQNGSLRYNTSTNTFEGYANNSWGTVAFQFGTTFWGPVKISGVKKTTEQTTNITFPNVVSATDTSITLTPTSTSSKFRIQATISAGINMNPPFDQNNFVIVRNDSTIIAWANHPAYWQGSFSGESEFGATIFFDFVDSPNTASPVTYGIYFGGSSSGSTTSIINSDRFVGNGSTVPTTELIIEEYIEYLDTTGGLLLSYDASEPVSYPGTGTTANSIGNLSRPADFVNSVTYNTSPSRFTLTPTNINTSPFLRVNGSRNDNDLRSEVFFSKSNSIEVWLNFASYTPTNFDGSESAQGIVIWPGSHQGLTITTTGIKYNVLNSDASSETSWELTGAPTNTWIHLCHVQNFSLSSNTWTWYVNGAQISSTSVTPFTSFFNNTQQFSGNSIGIGAARNDASFRWYLNGSIGLVNLYNSALTSQEVLSNFNLRRSIYGV